MLTRKRLFAATVFALAVIGLYLTISYVGSPMSVSAHGAYSDRVHAGANDLEIGREVETVRVGALTRFTINVVASTSALIEEDVKHTTGWVRLEHDDDILMTAWLGRQDDLLTGFAYAYQTPGRYVLSMKYYDGTTTVAAGDYVFDVEGGEYSETAIIMFIIGMLVGGTVIATIGRKHILGL